MSTVLTESPPLSASPADERRRLVDLLAGLFRAELDEEPDNVYLLEHSQPAAIANHVRTFQWYRPFLPLRGDLLEWGCQHGPDSCLLRATTGRRFDLHACDILSPDRYGRFREFADVRYKRLNDIVRLPYENDSFDGVIASGVLEHVAMDYESLKEVHRVMKRHAPLIITYLPNWLSIAEWRNRTFGRGGHQRLYGLAETCRLLKRTGFVPRFAGHHTFAWEKLCERLGLGEGGPIPAVLRTLVPAHRFCAVLRFVAVKETYM